MSLRTEPAETLELSRRLFGVRQWICCCAIVYAFLAGLKTVVDFDLGWQMATARYVWQHHAVPSTEVFSYTAHGAPWIYPVVSGAIFFLVHHIGGYTAISWLCALSCAATVAVLCAGASKWTAVLAVLSVPVIAEQTIPRSGMLTIFLFAIYARVLIDYFDGADARRLWILPVLMALWVNLHLGFIAGLGLIGAYGVLEISELPFAERRDAAKRRLRSAWPWLAAAAGATLLNPWGWRIWNAVKEQEFVSPIEAAFLQEFKPIEPLHAWSEWRNPDNAIYWMIAVAVVAAAVAVWRRHFGPAIVLLVAVVAVPSHARITGPFVSLVCVLGGREFPAMREGLRSRRLSWLAVSLVTALAAVRSVDLVTDRFYIADAQLTSFGAGPAWWFPDRATDFLRAHNLPRQLFSSFNLSSYLIWKLGEAYPDFGDGRYLPFGDALFYEQRALTQQPLDSPAWDEAVRKRDIRTVIFPLAPLLALGDVPLKQDCASTGWAPVFLDKTAIIFVRRDALSATSEKVLPVLCEAEVNVVTSGSRAERYQQALNAAGVAYLLGDLSRATTFVREAEDISGEDSALHLLKAEIAMAAGDQSTAERDFRMSVARMPGDSAWYGIGVLYMNEGRIDEALEAFRQSVHFASLERYRRLYALGKAYAVAKQPEEALRTLGDAESLSPFGHANSKSDEAREFAAQIAEAKATAFTELGDMAAALAELKRAVESTPRNPMRWHLLSETYAAFGLSSEAAEAEWKAKELQAADPVAQ